MATDAWKQLSDTLDVTRAYDLLDAAQVRIKRVPAVVIPTGRDSPEIREMFGQVGLTGLPVVLNGGDD